MERKCGRVYPNGIGKARLYEIFLSYRDFGCTADEYLFDLTIVRNGEATGEEHCYWREDEYGRLFVDGVSLVDDTKALLIKEDSFELISVAHKVFISYAKEDVSYAKRLYQILKRNGASPWLDEEDLVPGQRWEIEIEAQIYDADYFIALLSSRSVAKRGYVQREIRHALDVLDRIPEKNIYLIPARLDNCEPSHKALQNIQWVDLFPEWNGGLRKVFRAMNLVTAQGSN